MLGVDACIKDIYLLRTGYYVLSVIVDWKLLIQFLRLVNYSPNASKVIKEDLQLCKYGAIN